MREVAQGTFEGRTSQAEGKVGAKALRQQYSGVFRNSREGKGERTRRKVLRGKWEAIVMVPNSRVSALLLNE